MYAARWSAKLAVTAVLRCSILLVILTIAGCVAEYNPKDDEYVGKSAEKHLYPCERDELPGTIKDLWIFDGGSFNGMIYYTAFTCESIDDCWRALHALRAPEQSKFKEGVQTKFAVNQHGPNYYFKDYAPDHWDVHAIRHGEFYESAPRGNEFMDFWAIDYDRLRIYFHHESGGFPDDPPSKRHR